jgi:hypothetical protein
VVTPFLVYPQVNSLMGLTAQGVEGMTGVRRVPVDLQKN